MMQYAIQFHRFCWDASVLIDVLRLQRPHKSSIPVISVCTRSGENEDNCRKADAMIFAGDGHQNMIVIVVFTRM
ncbi:hypothetical protein Plhal304r1_c031g0101181 [Plasmopara halstedii]